MKAIIIEHIKSNKSGTKEFFDCFPVSIGAALNNNLVIEYYDFLSSSHALINYEDEEYIIYNLSNFGTYVNGELIEKKILYHNDQIKLGENGPVFKFLITEQEATFSFPSEYEQDSERRWYDKDTLTSKVFELMQTSDNEKISKIAKALINILNKQDPNNVYIKTGVNIKEVLTDLPRQTRWYDLNKCVQQVVESLKLCTPEMQEKFSKQFIMMLDATEIEYKQQALQEISDNQQWYDNQPNTTTDNSNVTDPENSKIDLELRFITCPVCDNQVYLNYKFCIFCGNEIGEHVESASFTICPNCHIEYHSNYTSCTNCGYTPDKSSQRKQPNPDLLSKFIQEAEIEKKGSGYSNQNECPFCNNLVDQETEICRHCSTNLTNCPFCEQNLTVIDGKCSYCEQFISLNELKLKNDTEKIKKVAKTLASKKKTDKGLTCLYRVYNIETSSALKKNLEKFITEYKIINNLPNTWEFKNTEGEIVFESGNINDIKNNIINGTIPSDATCRKNKFGTFILIKNSLAKEEIKIGLLYNSLLYSTIAGAAILGFVGAFAGFLYSLFFFFSYISQTYDMDFIRALSFVCLAILILIGIPTIVQNKVLGISITSLCALILIGISFGKITPLHFVIICLVFPICLAIAILLSALAGAIPGSIMGALIGLIIYPFMPKLPKTNIKQDNG